MLETLHLAAQYLAALGIQYVTPQADDSHSNLGWSTANASLNTHTFNGGKSYAALSFRTLTLEWYNNNQLAASLPLSGKTHKEIVGWVSQQAQQAGIEKAYNYTFHYELPYAKMTDDYQYKIDNQAELDSIIELLDTAQLGINTYLDNKNLSSPVRVWPHHFDLGAYFTVITGLSLGIGLAIPDSLSTNHYFYVSGYQNNESIDPEGFKPLTKGVWAPKGWNGALLDSAGISATEVYHFLTEAGEAFMRSYV